MLEIADGAMIGRGAIGNPLIFKEILHYLKTGKNKEFGFREKINLFKEYLKLTKKYDLTETKKIKFIGGNFIRGVAGAAKMRAELMSLKNYGEINAFVKRL